MAKNGKRKRVGYEVNVPRCKTCVHLQKASYVLVNSRPCWTNERCRKHEFEVRPDAICNFWENRQGDTLAQD